MYLFILDLGSAEIISDRMIILLVKKKCPRNAQISNLQMIDQYLNGLEQELVLPITTQGRVDALAMWFDLHLDSITSLSSAPEANSCWEQAIFPVLQCHLTSKSMYQPLFLSQQKPYLAN